MALATVDIVRLTGTGGSETETSIASGSTRWSTSDEPSPGASYPVPIPGAGTNYAYWVTTRLKVTANPDSHTVDNFRWYASTDSAPTGVSYSGGAAASGADSGYRIATGTLGATGDELNTTNHTGLGTVAPSAVSTWTSGSPLSLTGTTTSTGRVGDHFVYQAAVLSTATAQTVPTETFNWRYDDA